MTQEDGVKNLATRIATEINTVRSEITAGGVAIQGEIDALSDVVATKAAAADLTAAVGQIDDLSDVVATKANSADVTASLAGKASTTDLDNVFTIANEAVKPNNLRLPIYLTESAYEALDPPVAGQVYITYPG